MPNDNVAPEIAQLAIRTSAAFMLVDLLARVLDQRGILARNDLADDILAIVKARQAQLTQVKQSGGPDFTVMTHVLAQIARFASSDMRVP
jgi:hypothetical protein